MPKSRYVMLTFVMTIVAAACSGPPTDDTPTSEAEAATNTEAPAPTATEASAATTTEAPTAPTTTAAGPEGVIPDLNVGQALAPYGTENITTGSVVIYWYRGSAGTYLAVYTGQGIAEGAGLGLCPGNSIATTEFLHISNTPSEDGACDGFPTAAASLQVCDGGVWIYESVIPSDLDGTLFGSLEWNSAAGVTGLTSQTPTAADTPEFEYGLASYSIPPWLTSDGSTMITCEVSTA